MFWGGEANEYGGDSDCDGDGYGDGDRNRYAHVDGRRRMHSNEQSYRDGVRSTRYDDNADTS